MITIATDIVNAGSFILAAVLFVLSWNFWRHSSEYWRWIKLLQAIMGLYWCCVYVYVLFSSHVVYDPVLFGQIFIRPAFTLTLGIMAAGAIARWKIK